MSLNKQGMRQLTFLVPFSPFFQPVFIVLPTRFHRISYLFSSFYQPVMAIDTMIDGI